MKIMFNQKIVPILSLSAFATVLGAQVAQAEIINNVNPASGIIGKSTQNTSQTASTTLAQTEIEIEETETETEVIETPATETPFPSQQSSFTDVDTNNWAYPFIQTLAANNLIAGFPDGSFRPEELVTRAQAAAMMQKAFELPIPQVTQARFTDVPVNYWAAPAIEAAYQQNFLSASPGNLFLPNQSIIKSEMIDYLASGLQLTATGSAVDVVNATYTDARQIPVFAIDEIAAATEANMVVNYPDVSTLNPRASVTRAEMVAHLYQALVKLGQVEPISANEPAASYIVGGPGGAMAQTTTTPTQPEEQETQTTPDTEGNATDLLVTEDEVIGPTAPSYIGIGGSLGLIEDEFGDFGAFAVTSKLRIFSLLNSEEGGTDISLRPSVIIGNEVSFLVPATIDLRLAPFAPFTNIGADAFVPYLGPGFTVTTGDDSAFKFLLVAGLDIPMGNFTTNAQFNIGFLDETALGLTLSVGYNF